MTNQAFRLLARMMALTVVLHATAHADPADPADPSSTTQAMPNTNTVVSGACENPTTPNGDGCDNLYPMMVEYQKSVARENREDKKLESEDLRLRLELNGEPLKSDREASDVGSDVADDQAGPALHQQEQTPLGELLRLDNADSVATPCHSPAVSCPEPCDMPPCR